MNEFFDLAALNVKPFEGESVLRYGDVKFWGTEEEICRLGLFGGAARPPFDEVDVLIIRRINGREITFITLHPSSAQRSTHTRRRQHGEQDARYGA